MLGGILSIAGAVAALWLVRERDIERGEELEAERVRGGERGAGARRRRSPDETGSEAEPRGRPSAEPARASGRLSGFARLGGVPRGD